MRDETTDLYEQKVDYLIRTAFTDQALLENNGSIGDNFPADLSPETLNLTDEIGRVVADEMLRRGTTRVIAESVREKIKSVMPEVLAKHAERLADIMSPEMMRLKDLDLPDIDVD